MSKVKKEYKDASTTMNGFKRPGETILINSRTMIPKFTSQKNPTLFEITDLSSINPYSRIVYKDLNSLPEKVQDYYKNKRVKWALKSRTLELQAEAYMRLIESEQIIVRNLNRLLCQLSSEDWGQESNSNDFTNSFVPHSPLNSSSLVLETSESVFNKEKKIKNSPVSKESSKQNDSSFFEDKDSVVSKDDNVISQLKGVDHNISASKELSDKFTKKDFLTEEKSDPKETEITIPSENNSNLLHLSSVPIPKDIGHQQEPVDERLDTQETTESNNDSSTAQPEKISVIDCDHLNNSFNHKPPDNFLSTNCSRANSSFPPIHKSVDNLISKVQASLDHSRHFIHLLQQTRQALIRQSTNNVRLYQELRDTRKVPDPSEISNVIVDIV